MQGPQSLIPSFLVFKYLAKVCYLTDLMTEKRKLTYINGVKVQRCKGATVQRYNGSTVQRCNGEMMQRYNDAKE
jgi:hypothetical protein